MSVTCGSNDPAHRSSECDACARIYRKRSRERGTHISAHHPDDLTEEQRGNMCPSCRVRYLRNPEYREMPSAWQVKTATFRWIEARAAEFDADTLPGEHWTASDFVAWIKPEVVSGERYEALRRMMREREDAA